MATIIKVEGHCSNEGKQISDPSITMDIAELKKQINVLNGLMKIFEGRIVALETAAHKKSQSSNSNVKVKKEKLSDGLIEYTIDNVTSIVGLKEAITSRSYHMKILWTLLFLAGLMLTGYFIYKTYTEYLEENTVTSVKLVRQDTYPYPPMVLCPSDVWIDYNKVQQYNLSMAGLQYSLGYMLSQIGSVPAVDLAAGKADFLQFFKSSNFTSLQEYFKTLSVDIVLANESTSDLSTYTCIGCHNRQHLNKIFFVAGTCYEIPLLPARSTLSAANGALFGITLFNHTRSAHMEYPILQIYLAESPQYGPLYLDPAIRNGIIVKSQQFNVLNSDSQPCDDSGAVTSTTRFECIKRCEQKITHKHMKCAMLYITPPEDAEGVSPNEYCNFFELATALSVQAVLGNASVLLASIEACSRRCIQPCKHTADELTVQSLPFPKAWLNKEQQCREANVTGGNCARGYNLVFDFTAAKRGIIVMTETYTFSLATLIGNVGGTLGLFVGATGLTLVQVVVCFLSYFLLKAGLAR